MRGEGLGKPGLNTGRKGRSPHARGRQETETEAVAAFGSIPACAGKADTSDYSRWVQKVDPRMRGEGSSRFRRRQSNPGRSPHARGRRIPLGPGLRRIRSIPACAGKALVIVVIIMSPEVDPRMRGEGAKWERTPGVTEGRSPHARGRRPMVSLVSIKCGSIPACAGKAGDGAGGRDSWRVDPRMRGEGIDRVRLEINPAGRSPHARGRRLYRRPAPRFGGSIPACAGKAVRRSLPERERKVDPRMRGEGSRN